MPPTPMLQRYCGNQDTMMRMVILVGAFGERRWAYLRMDSSRRLSAPVSLRILAKKSSSLRFAAGIVSKSTSFSHGTPVPVSTVAHKLSPRNHLAPVDPLASL